MGHLDNIIIWATCKSCAASITPFITASSYKAAITVGGHPPPLLELAVPDLEAVRVTGSPLQSLNFNSAVPTPVAVHGLGTLIIVDLCLFFENLLCNSISELLAFTPPLGELGQIKK